MSHHATEDAHYPDGVTLKEVWDAMRAAADTENYIEASDKDEKDDEREGGDVLVPV